MSKKNSSIFSDLNALTEQVVKSVISDMSILTEDERDEQEKTEKLLQDDSSSIDKKEEVNEDEEDAQVTVPRAGSSSDGNASADPNADKSIEQPSIKDFTNAKLSDVIEQINMMRSGKSLKDKEVQSSLSKYYNRLKAGERQVFMVFMSALSQILSGDIDGESAPSPKGLDIEILPKEKRAEREIEKSQDNTPKGTIVVGGI